METAVPPTATMGVKSRRNPNMDNKIIFIVYTTNSLN